MTKETSYTFYVLGIWHLFNRINFSFINFNTFLRNFVPQDNAFINHKVTLSPIQDETSVFTYLQNSIKVAQAKISNILNMQLAVTKLAWNTKEKEIILFLLNLVIMPELCYLNEIFLYGLYILLSK